MQRGANRAQQFRLGHAHAAVVAHRGHQALDQQFLAHRLQSVEHGQHRVQRAEHVSGRRVVGAEPREHAVQAGDEGARRIGGIVMPGLGDDREQGHRGRAGVHQAQTAGNPGARRIQRFDHLGPQQAAEAILEQVDLAVRVDQGEHEVQELVQLRARAATQGREGQRGQGQAQRRMQVGQSIGIVQRLLGDDRAGAGAQFVLLRVAHRARRRVQQAQQHRHDVRLVARRALQHLGDGLVDGTSLAIVVRARRRHLGHHRRRSDRHGRPLRG